MCLVERGQTIIYFGARNAGAEQQVADDLGARLLVLDSPATGWSQRRLSNTDADWHRSDYWLAQYHPWRPARAREVLTIEEQCWRMVMPDGPAKMRHPTNCPEPVSWTGRHQWRNGAWVKVWSCDEHADALVGIRRF